MRITVDIKPGQGDELFLHVAGRDVKYCRPVTWLTDRLLAARGTDVISDLAEMERAVECCDTDGDEEKREQLERLEEYGRLLFEATFGAAEWQQILMATTTARADYLEVAVRGSANDDCVALQALRWEALHDGKGFVVAQGATYQGKNIPVGVVRLISPSGVVPGNGAVETMDLPEITYISRVLFAVGSHLTDPDVRPGAEFMGIMRRLDRNGGSIRARVLESATRPGLVAELTAFKPDVLHLIGHGEVLEDGQVRVQLRGEFGGEYYASAEDLLGAFAEAEHWPVMVVLSACLTAAAGAGQKSSLPFAARLVAGNSVSRGVPIVVAMAGDISDTACRVFTQALTTAIGDGVPLGKAVIRGRRAAFYRGPSPGAQHPAPDSGHWVMPVLFLADFVPRDACLVQADSVKALQQRVQILKLVDEPVFYGRTPFLNALDQLLDATPPALKVLVAYISDPSKSYGGLRLLQELGAQAVRSGVLPVLLGRYDNDGPRDLMAFALALEECINEIRANLLGLGLCRIETVAAVGDGAKGLSLATAIRNDLDALVAALPEDDHVRSRAAGLPRVILLCHRVDEWAPILNDLLGLLGPRGLDGGTTPIPVVLTGADVRELKTAREGRRWGQPGWVKFEKLRRFQGAGDRDEDGADVDPALRNEDILAYQWWLLNPPVDLDGRQLAFAPKRGVPDNDWKHTLRTVMNSNGLMYHSMIYQLAAGWSCLVKDNDDALLASYAQVLR